MKVIILVFAFLYNIITVKADELCYQTYTFETENFISTFLSYIKVIIPVALVILIAIDMISVVVSKDPNILDKKIKRSLKRVIIALITFLVPSILMDVTTDVLGVNVFKDTTVCMTKELTEKPEITAIYDMYGNQIYPEVIYNNPSSGNNDNSSSSSSTGCDSNGSYTVGSGGDHYKKTITMNCRTYKIYNQHSYNQTFIKSPWTISRNGCSLVSLAIALSGYDSSIDPLDLNKYYVRKSLSTEAASAYGYSLIRVPANADAIRAFLNKGVPVIFLEGVAKSSGYPANKYAVLRHYIVILGETKDGTLVLGNSSTSAQTGTFTEIISKYQNYGFWAVVKG